MISMSLVNGGSLVRSLESFIQKNMNLVDYRDPVLDYMEEEKDRNFKTEGGSMQINGKRNPLSPVTQQARAKRSGYYRNAPSNPGILRWTGNLQDKIKRKKDFISCSITFLQDYAKYHQGGTGRMKRPLFEFSPSVKAEIIREIQTEFNSRIGVWNARKA